MNRAILALAALLALAGCRRDDMDAQGKYQSWDRNPTFRNHAAMRPPVDGTIARNPANPDIAQPASITTAMLARGHERFDIFCSGCHGLSGDGAGMIVQRGFQKPPELFSDRLMHAPAAHLYDVLTNGYGYMYSFAERLNSADRWAVIAYVRALQQSQSADPATLPQADRDALQASR